MSERPYLSLVLPARNEAPIIGETVRRVVEHLERTLPSYEILVGDSASEDGTSEAARTQGHSAVRVLREESAGKGRILSRALSEARGEIVGFIDADLEIGLDALDRMIDAIEGGADAAIASKTGGGDAERPARRRLVTRLFNATVRRLFRTPFADHQAGLKLFRRVVLRPALARTRSSGWLWDTEILVHLSRARAHVEEIPVVARPTRPSRISSLAMVSAVLELGGLGWRTFSSPAPRIVRAVAVPEGPAAPEVPRIHV